MAERVRRIPIMLSPAELQAIDDWRFANRIGTRAGAVRALCAKALADERDVNTAHNNKNGED